MVKEILSAGIDDKKKLVSELAEEMKKAKTILIVSTKGLPSSQFQDIKKKMRGKAVVKVAKKTIVLRAISETEKGAMQNLKENIGADVALFLSELDAFELSGLLSDNQSPAKAKVGDIAPEDIKIEEGPTELIPGPAISELGAVGLKVVVENGKLAIKQGRVIVKSGEEIDEKVAGVLGKLNILPMKVGFIPIAAYDSVSDKVYVEIKIDKGATFEELKNCISKALGFATNIGYVAPDTIKIFIVKAGREEMTLRKLINVGEEKVESDIVGDVMKDEKKKKEENIEVEKKENVNKEKENNNIGEGKIEN
jgi:large subunit ribosomal protein L10